MGLLRVGELEVRTTDGLVMLDGRGLALSRRELQLLIALAERQNSIVPREELYALTWGGELRPRDRCVDVYIHKLRAKLERAMPTRDFIHTHHGFGYRLSSEPSQHFHNLTTAP